MLIHLTVRRQQRDDQDDIVRDTILKAYNFKGQKRSTTNKNDFRSTFDIVYNLKRIGKNNEKIRQRTSN